MKWEYRHALATIDLEVLNDYGQQGWELICAFRGIDDDLYYIYKRPVPFELAQPKSAKEVKRLISQAIGSKID